MLDAQKEFGDWIRELGFNKRPISYNDNTKEYIFKP
jgi:hypothetical protein